MKKDLLKEQLVDFQKRIISLSQEVRAKEREFQEKEDSFFLEIFTVLDAFENVFDSLKEKEQTFDKSAKKGMKSFRAIYRKLLRTLEEKEVEKIEFPDRQARMGLCTVIETQRRDDQEEGMILSVVKNGYCRKDRILRPAEVVTVSNESLDEP
jgi:molecular chaperone GrpE (heat shock protein)